MELRDQISLGEDLGKIPSVVYQTWETKKFGRTHYISNRLFRNRNRSFTFKLFDATERDSYIRHRWRDSPLEEMYFRARFGQIKADLFRYMIVFDLGGFYFDISKVITRPLRKLIQPEVDGIISFENNRRVDLSSHGSLTLFPENLVLQWGFAFAPRHELLSSVLRQIGKKFSIYKNIVQENPKQAILELTGPIAFTASVDIFFSKFPHNKVRQVGIDFDGSAILSLPGSAARHKLVPAYGQVTHEKLFK
jgi:mannosyltransferase OCH1-like enzyme